MGLGWYVVFKSKLLISIIVITKKILDDKKVKELTSPKQHTLVVKDEHGKRHGITCFRWLLENDEPVLYLYEIQLEEDACRIGIGPGI